MDKYDRDRYSAAYRLLAEILERDHSTDAPEDHLSFVLGDLARRVFVGHEFDPPDEILEQTSDVIRTGSGEERQMMARRLQSHADHLDELDV